MNRLRRLLALTAAAMALAAGAALAEPESAAANPVCNAATKPVEAVSGAADAITGGIVGGGNPVQDVCNAVTDGAVGTVTSPVSDALEGVGNSIFNEITRWVTDGATYLIGEVVKGMEKTTTPDLTSKGFLRQYGQMAAIASVLAMAMLLFAILEAVAQSSWAILGRAVFLSVPLAFLGTSVAFVVVQMLLVATDQMSHAVAAATENQSTQFFRNAVKSLGEAGGAVGGELGKNAGPAQASQEAGGAVAAPLFVTFLAAIIGAFAAFFVWIELLMRDAAIYVVALFMPLALAASIWPRWSGALRRTCELLVVIIASKFVIVSIIALAAGLLGEEDGDVENILAASALLLLACFAPFILFKLVPFAEGAMSAAYSRRSAAGGAHSAFSLANEARAVHDLARGNWGGGASPPDVWDVKGGGGGGGGGPSGGGGNPAAPSPGGGGGSKAGAGAGSSGAGSKAAGSAGAGAAAAPAAAAAVPVAAAKGAHSAAERMAASSIAEATGGGGSGSAPSPSSRPAERAGSAGAPAPAPAAGESGAGTKAPSEQPPRPPQDVSVKPTPESAK